MKKIFNLLVVVCAVLLISGCGKNNEESITVCTLTNNNSSGYKLESTYEIYGKGKVVLNVVSTEIITSDDQDILKSFEETLKTTYQTANDNYGGYNFNITLDNEKVISKVEINYDEMNLNQLIKDDSQLENYVDSNNKLLIAGLKNMYESLGATCN